MSAQTKEKCPLCLEAMDLTDKHLKPCKCGYEICLWCWHRIMGMDQKDESGGRCPGCRSVYNKDRILETSVKNQTLKEICSDKSSVQKEQTKSHKQKSSKGELGLAEEPKDPNSVRVIQRKLVYIIGMPSEFASEKVLRQKSFLGQYGKIENIVIDNFGANPQIPDSGRVYATFSREEEAVRCIQAVNGYILDGKPLKATFGVTRYCHVWLSNNICRKPNCSYVHYKAPAEDICTKDDVSVFCSRLQLLMGMDMKGFQHRSGRTLPPPVDSNSRTTFCSGVSKDICTNNDRLPPNGANKDPGLLPDTTTPRDLGNSTSNAKQMTSAENGTSDTSQHKPQYVSVVSQGQGGSGRRFTVLTRQTASADTRSKATGQVGNGTSNSTKPTFVKNEHSDCTAIPRSQNVNLVSQRTDQPSPLLASTSIKYHAGVEKKNECSDIIEKLLPGSHKKLPENAASNSSTPLQSTSANLSNLSSTPLQSTSANLSNLSTSKAKSQVSAGPLNLSDLNGKLGQSQLQLVHKQNAPGISSASVCRSIPNIQVPSADGKHKNSAQGGQHCFPDREITRSGNQSSESTLLSRPVSAVSSSVMAVPDGQERKRQICPPGFEKLLHSDAGKFVSSSSAACSEPCSRIDALVQDSCGTSDQPHLISLASKCLEDAVDVTEHQNVNISSLRSADTSWRHAQLPGTCFSGLSNHPQQYPSGFLQRSLPSATCPAYEKPEYLGGTAGSYMPTGAYDAFCQGTISGRRLLQQPPLPNPHHGWSNGNTDSGMNCPQVDISYPRGYTLF